MRLFFDTSFLVELDRNRHINLMKKISEHDLFISTITVSEFLIGVYYNENKDKLKNAKKFLMQFTWIDFDGEISDNTAIIEAKQLKNGKLIDFKDNAILATFIVKNMDYLITLNKKHFNHQNAVTPDEFLKHIN